MPTPSKPVEVLASEGKSHRTKEELSNRKKEEKALLSGLKIKELPQVKENPIAHREYVRVCKLLKSIGKDDELYSGAINRYCMLSAECKWFEERMKTIDDQIDELSEKQDNFDYPEFIKMQDNLQRNLINIDKQIQSKRKMMFDIEKENVMTIASALRSIPKKQAKKTNPLQEALSDD